MRFSFGEGPEGALSQPAIRSIARPVGKRAYFVAGQKRIRPSDRWPHRLDASRAISQDHENPIGPHWINL